MERMEEQMISDKELGYADTETEGEDTEAEE